MINKLIVLDVESPRYRVLVGRQGENAVTAVEIDCTDYIQRYGEGTPSLVCKNPNESTTYSVPLIREGTVVTWVVGIESTATAGRGQAVLLWYPNNGGEAKTADIEFCVEVSAVHNNAVSVIAMIEDLKEQIKQIQEDGIDNEAIERVISEYLTEHPIEGVTADAVRLMLAEYVKTGELNAAISNYVNDHKAELKGDKGDTGPQGIQGPVGATGADGMTGPKGDKGDTGSTGPKGDTGERGEAGQKGDKGDKGDPFTYADFTAEQLESLRGPKGDKGDPGEGGTVDEEQLQTLIDNSLSTINAGLSELESKKIGYIERNENAIAFYNDATKTRLIAGFADFFNPQYPPTDTGGVTKVMAETLHDVIRAWAFISPSFATSDTYLSWCTAWGVEPVEGGSGGTDEPVDPPIEPETPTLTGITVTWLADSANVGTDPKTLISVVKANYSDGSNQTVTGYTVSPSALVAGANTVTVTYQGKTATKSITGNSVAEPITINASYPITLSWNPSEHSHEFSDPLGEVGSEYEVEIDVQSISSNSAYPVMAIVGSGATAFCNWQTSAGQTGTLKTTARIGFGQGAGATKCQLSCNKGSESSNQTCVVTGLRVYRK